MSKLTIGVVGTSKKKDETIRKAININAGVIQSPSILSFQNRQHDYPHAPIKTLV
ncbi:MAG: hypothetical protein GY915_08135 [bacterium]|nr:hypothetical protein [bacterium]